jgi:PHD/YefM family antitoxin component YafN of YafNO toxin-antitoxin module
MNDSFVIPMLKTLDVAQCEALLAEYVKDPKHEPIILTNRGKPIAVVLSVDGADVETISVSLNPDFQAFMDRSRERQGLEPGIPIEEVRREFGLPPYKEKAKRKSRKPRTTNRKRSPDGSQV